jgi:hypothetical protein
VDLDGTLAQYDGFKGRTVIGNPIPAMVDKVKAQLADGRDVRIMTARASDNDPKVISAIEKWCVTHLGQKLKVTHEKDPHMDELWDDRARRVVTNTGEFATKGMDASDPSRFFDVFEVSPAKNVKFKKSAKRNIVRRTTFQGLPISIETDKGQTRAWHDPASGESGKTKMNYPYGYIRRTEGADGDEIDVFIGPTEASKQVFIVHQRKKPTFTQYDEDKIMLGFESPREAKAAYLEHYDDRRFFGSMTETTIDDFKRMFIENAKKAIGMEGSLVGAPPPPPMPMAPMGMPGMPMMGMGPPPTDVETFEGVQALLGRIGTVADQQLMEIASTIWGNGYTFAGQSPDQARQEIIGFLLDQRDLLGVAPDPLSMQPSPSSPVAAAPGSSDYSAVSTLSQIASTDPQPVASFSDAGSQNQSLMNWFAQDLSGRAG